MTFPRNLLASAALFLSASVTIYSEDLVLSSFLEPISIGKWVLHKDGKPSEWLGVKYENKTLYEPINIVIIDSISLTESSSILTLERQCELAGFKKEFGHSSGYFAQINGKILEQIPREWRTAFSDNVFWEENNHGRLFGPYRGKEGYIYTGSFSRERFVLFGLVHHNYLSFEQARESFASSLKKNRFYEEVGRINIGNVEKSSSDISTGDHDGYVIIMKSVG